MSSAPRPFIFDTVFEDDGRVVAPLRPKKSFLAEEVEVIRAQCFAEGERSAVAKAQEAQAARLAEIARLAEGALGTLALVAHDHRVGSAKLALAAARKIADAALDAFPQAPLQAALTALAREIEAVPRLIARVQPDQVAASQTALDQAAQAAGYPGQIIVRADPGMAPAAFVLDWGDGSAAFDPAAAAARVAHALDEALASDGLHAEFLPAPDSDPTASAPGAPDEADHG
jgi:flagellar assembly protein FliH